MADVEIPHFAFPFRLGRDGSVEAVEQDTQEELEQGVQVLLLTHQGERLEVPDFGIDSLVFQNDFDLRTIQAEAEEWDERVEVLFSEEPDRVTSMIRHLLVQVAPEGEE